MSLSGLLAIFFLLFVYCRHAPGFLELLLSANVCIVVCVCVCVYVRVRVRVHVSVCVCPRGN